MKFILGIAMTTQIPNHLIINDPVIVHDPAI